MRRSTWPLALLAMALLQPTALAQKAPRQQAYCYYDARTLTWRLGNDAVERTIHFDRSAGSLCTTKVVVKLRGAALASVANSDGEFTVTPEGGKPSVLSLDSDWDFMFPIVHNGEDGSRTLTIHLQGKGRNAGYEVEATYGIEAGKFARLTDRRLLVNRTAGPVRLENVVIGRWILPEPAGSRATAQPAKLVAGPGKGIATLSLGKDGPALVAAVERGDEGGGPTVMDGYVLYQQNALVLGIRPDATIAPAARWQSTRATIWAQPGEASKPTHHSKP